MSRRTRVGAVLAAACALAMALLGNPASAATHGVSRPAGIFPNGEVVIWQNVNSKLCLTFAPDARGAAEQESCTDPHIPFSSFEWNAYSSDGETYEFVNQTQNQCLSVMNSSTADGAPIFIYNCVGSWTQVFTVVPAGVKGEYELVNPTSGKCVAVGGASKTAGAWVIQWTCDGGPEDLWQSTS